jgi:hypothetical protein
MNAKELIRQVKVEKSTGWKNSDLYVGVEKLLEEIVSHYEHCEECRDAFDDMGYEEETLKDMELLFMQNMDLERWICEEVA